MKQDKASVSCVARGTITTTQLQPPVMPVNEALTTTAREPLSATSAPLARSATTKLPQPAQNAVQETTRTRKGLQPVKPVLRDITQKTTVLRFAMNAPQVISSTLVVEEAATGVKRESSPTLLGPLSANNAPVELTHLREAWQTAWTVLRERMITITPDLSTAQRATLASTTTKQDRRNVWHVKQAPSLMKQDKHCVLPVRQDMLLIRQDRASAKPANQGISLPMKDLQLVMPAKLEPTATNPLQLYAPPAPPDPLTPRQPKLPVSHVLEESSQINQGLLSARNATLESSRLEVQ